MGIILGYVLLRVYLVLMMKWVARKFNITRVNNILGKLHKPLGVIALILGIVHFIVVIPVMKNRDVLVNFTGVLAFVLMVAIIVSCHVTRNNKVKMKLHRIFTIIAFACIIGHIVTYFADFMEYQNNIENIEIGMVDCSDLEDGMYVGEYDAGYIYAKVKVQVKDEKIVSIDLLEHRNEKGKPAEQIIDDILKRQQIDVDEVSGATNSSKVIKKAIENAIGG